MFYRILSFFVTVFALFQFGHTEKAQAAVSVSSDTGLSKFETSIHASGCGCSRCIPPSETNIKDFPA